MLMIIGESAVTNDILKNTGKYIRFPFENDPKLTLPFV